MTQTRPRLYPAAKPPLTTEQRVSSVERASSQQAQQIVEQGVVIVDQGEALDMLADAVAGLPPTGTIWTTDRPASGFGVGTELTWTAVADGVATSVPVPGRLTLNPARYTVVVGGVVQRPSVYSLPGGSETLVFAEAPPSGVIIHVHAPFYGSAT